MGNKKSLSARNNEPINNTIEKTKTDEKYEETKFIITKKQTNRNSYTDRNNNILNRDYWIGSNSLFCAKKKSKKKIVEERGINRKGSFTIHGIDYLHEAAKKKERRKKNVPKFLELPNWPPLLSILQTHDQKLINSNTNNNTFNSHTISNKSNKNHSNIKTNKTENNTKSEVYSNSNSNENLLDQSWKEYKDFPFNKIVMSGGGSKGYAYIGALKALEDCGVLEGAKKLAGSSAGAICAGLLAVGCSSQEIADVFKCDIKWLFHDQRCPCCCLPGMYSTYGMHPAKRFHKTYGHHLRKKTGSADITFKQVYDRTGVELCIVVTNLSRMCSEYCNHTTCANLPIRDAVRMSMSFPVMYRAVRVNLTGRECLYTDGGLLDQFPVSYFDDESRFSAIRNVRDEGEDDYWNGMENKTTQTSMPLTKQLSTKKHLTNDVCNDNTCKCVEHRESYDEISESSLNINLNKLPDNKNVNIVNYVNKDKIDVNIKESDKNDNDKRANNNDYDAHNDKENNGNVDIKRKSGERRDCDKNANARLPDFQTLGLYVVSERAVDHKIWRALFGCPIPYRPTYMPNTKLARARLKNEMSIRKIHDKEFNEQEFMEDLAMATDQRQHYELIHKSHVDIRSLPEYFITAIEALLISQRKVRVRKEDRLRTVAINCGYIGTNDYEIEPGDREFMIDQGYSCTQKYLKDFIRSYSSSSSTSLPHYNQHFRL